MWCKWRKNDNIDLDYSKEKIDENTIINTDEQLSESEITILGELYKIIEKTPEEATQHLLRSDLLEKAQWKIEKHKDALGKLHALLSTGFNTFDILTFRNYLPGLNGLEIGRFISLHSAECLMF